MKSVKNQNQFNPYDSYDSYEQRDNSNKPSNYVAPIWALSLDFGRMPQRDVATCCMFIARQLGVEFNFVIEEKKKNNERHIHAYFGSEPNHSETYLHKFVAKWFRGHSFKIKEVFHLNGWQNYLTKENKKIIVYNGVTDEVSSISK
ncbi:hypothetical protein [Algoriella sp.]|uniref:hypothetical protein n=1 Tax=Algoriella sp. TaxID=1872434 RepID=UPI001B2A37A3|nr:hypothetical protein [Algoriella sp.]MBO6212988.1 hypothetical protein [Algoriella sp.]